MQDKTRHLSKAFRQGKSLREGKPSQGAWAKQGKASYLCKVSQGTYAREGKARQGFRRGKASQGT
jgi:hypothetical protein